MDRGDQRGADVAQQAVAERLVVVDDVELAAPGRADGGGRAGEKVSGSGKPPVHMVATSSGVDPVAVLAAPRGAERVGLAVQVEAGQLGEAVDARAGLVVQHRVGLGADDLDAVAEPGELAREVAYVDALAAAERVPLVGEERDAQRSLAVRGGDPRRGPASTGLSGHSRPPSPCVSPETYAGTLI